MRVRFSYFATMTLGLAAGCDPGGFVIDDASTRDVTMTDARDAVSMDTIDRQDMGSNDVVSVDAMDVVERVDSGPRDGMSMDAMDAVDRADIVSSDVDSGEVGAGECGVGTNACNDACVPNSPTACGAACLVCPTPANGNATCVAGACDIACTTPYVAVAGACDIPVPQQLSPVSSSIVPSHSPLFVWQSAPGVGARLEICADPMCATVLSTNDVPSLSSFPSPMPLAPGVYFWRLHGLVGSTVSGAASPVWEFRTVVTDVLPQQSYGSVPDFNLDGLSDVAIGTQQLAGSGAPGSVATVSGTSGAIPTVIDATVLYGTSMAAFGQSVASAADVNGDGYSDLVVGLCDEPLSVTPTVFVYLGGPSGLSDSNRVQLDAPMSPSPPTYNELFGWSVAGVGDLDGDGYSDVVVGAPGLPTAATGHIYVYRGGPTGPANTPALMLAPPSGVLDQDFGRVVVATGDMDGDGLVDFGVASPASGRVWVFSGYPPTGAMLMDTVAGDNGVTLAGGGDVTGDGHPDLLVGYPNMSSSGGFVYCFSGATLHPAATSVSPAFTVSQGQQFGLHVAIIGDTNNDGAAEWAAYFMGARSSIDAFYGAATSAGLLATWTAGTGFTSSANFGSAVSSGGDLNGDGRADLLVGDYGFPGAFVFGGITDTPVNYTVSGRASAISLAP